MKIPVRIRSFLASVLLAVLISTACHSQPPVVSTRPPAHPTLLSLPAEAHPKGTPTPTVHTLPAERAPELIWSKEIIIFPASPVPGEAPVHYLTQAGDTLAVVAARFGIDTGEIMSPLPLPAEDLLLDPGQLLILPPVGDETQPAVARLPDSEIVYGVSAAGFSAENFLDETGGYLGRHQEWLRSTEWTSAASVVSRVAIEYSINPRLLLAVLEQQCQCVYGQLAYTLTGSYALGVEDYHRTGLYGQLAWAANELSVGYYGWRTGLLREILLPDGIIFRPAPDLNAGTVALQYLTAQMWRAHQEAASRRYGKPLAVLSPVLDRSGWEAAQLSLALLYEQISGSPTGAEPLASAGQTQPQLILPFEMKSVWSLASGPHFAWDSHGVLAALDFAPASKETGCVPSAAWVTASGAGLVTRSEFGLVVQDLDGDGYEGSGWVILYMHIATDQRVPAGTFLAAGDRIGHPSCEGGRATGTHVHIARKYNGEWIAAAGPLPIILDGWTAQAGMKPYEGSLVKDGKTINAHPNGARDTLIWRSAPGEESPAATPAP